MNGFLLLFNFKFLERASKFDVELFYMLAFYTRIYLNRRNSLKFMLLISNAFVFKLFPLMWIGLKLLGENFSQEEKNSDRLPSPYIIDHVQQISPHSITFAFNFFQSVWIPINKSLDLRNIYRISLAFCQRPKDLDCACS